MSVNAAAIKLSIWAAQHSAATRLIMSALPVALSLAAAVVLKRPLHVHNLYVHPACGSGGGGSGGC